MEIMKPKNLKEFKKLKKRYESITLKEIKGVKGLPFTSFDALTIANKLTGFACHSTCTLLCTSISCMECVYNSESMYDSSMCFKGENEKTYYRIQEADTPTKLRNAFRARAKHMGTLLK